MRTPARGEIWFTPRAIDYAARRSRYVEAVPEYLMDEVLARLQAIVE